MRRVTLLLALSLIALAPLASDDAQSSGCRAPDASETGLYPDHPLSPLQSLQNYDAVFLGEVAVPTKACSLGYCAGLRVIKTLKGHLDSTTLLQVSNQRAAPCGPSNFATKGQRWLVFANHGTSPGGMRYLRAGDDGPSFVAAEVPDFRRLEQHYRMVRAQLDQAIEERLGRVR